MFLKNLKSLKKDKLLTSAFVLAVAGFLCKGIGALYRMPLTAIIGADGLGIYQTVFPVYCLLLTFSSTGVPSGLSKLVANGQDEGLLKRSVILLGGLGAVGSLLIFCFSNELARLQGEANAALSYRLLSPSVFIVSVIACVRGSFQGRMDMVPTAVSQIIEQLVKLAVGLALARLGRNQAEKAALAAFAVTVSELAALIYLGIKYFRFKQKHGCLGSGKTLSTLRKRKENAAYRLIIRAVFPITLSAIALPALRTLDSFLVINLLKTEALSATAAYGLYSGCVESVISLPVSVCYGVAAAAVPYLTKKGKREWQRVLVLTFLLSSFFAVGLYAFSPIAVKILFARLSESEIALLVRLLRASAVNVILLSMLQTLSATLIAFGKPLVSGGSLAACAPLKAFVLTLALKNPALGVFACPFSDTACFFVAGLLDLVYIIKDEKNSATLISGGKGRARNVVFSRLGSGRRRFIS